MSSNCYVIWDDESKRCVVIDPGSEESLRERKFLTENKLILDYIILTHEHTDHNWGVNALKNKYSHAKTFCHSNCASEIIIPKKSYFRLYLDRENYSFSIKEIDITFCKDVMILNWENYQIEAIHSPGHCKGAICIILENMIFSGDSILQSKPYIDKRTGSEEEYYKSIEKVKRLVSWKKMTVYPGHGESFEL